MALYSQITINGDMQSTASRTQYPLPSMSTLRSPTPGKCQSLD